MYYPRIKKHSRKIADILFIWNWRIDAAGKGAVKFFWHFLWEKNLNSKALEINLGWECCRNDLTLLIRIKSVGRRIERLCKNGIHTAVDRVTFQVSFFNESFLQWKLKLLVILSVKNLSIFKLDLSCFEVSSVQVST